MTTPNGIRTESTRTPKASRAGALQIYSTLLYVTPRPASHLANVDTREDSLVSVGRTIDADLRDAGKRHRILWPGVAR